MFSARGEEFTALKKKLGPDGGYLIGAVKDLREIVYRLRGVCIGFEMGSDQRSQSEVEGLFVDADALRKRIEARVRRAANGKKRKRAKR